MEIGYQWVPMAMSVLVVVGLLIIDSKLWCIYRGEGIVVEKLRYLLPTVGGNGSWPSGWEAVEMHVLKVEIAAGKTFDLYVSRLQFEQTPIGMEIRFSYKKTRILGLTFDTEMEEVIR